MVEIRYGENYEEVDLTGKTVAEVREQYKEQFGIPDKAQVSLGGKVIKQKHESDTWLGEGDKLTFAQKSRKGLVFTGALALAIAITSGVFAYTYTTATLSLAATAKTEFATVIKNASAPTSITTTGTVWHRWHGSVPTGDLFDITPEATYSGDLVVKVYLTNQTSLVKGYQHLNMKIQLWSAALGTGTNMTDWQTAPTYTDTTRFELLTLDNGVVTIALQGYSAGNTFYIYCAGGTFKTHPWNITTDSANLSPDLYCEVVQAQ